MTLFIASFLGISFTVLLMVIGVVLHSRPLKHGCGGNDRCNCKKNALIQTKRWKSYE